MLSMFYYIRGTVSISDQSSVINHECYDVQYNGNSNYIITTVKGSDNPAQYPAGKFLNAYSRA